MAQKEKAEVKEVEALEEVSQQTGLTPRQEQTATLLASGMSITEVAEKVGIDRKTIYRWQRNVAYKCYFNRISADSRNTLLGGINGLAEDALRVISSSLHSAEESIRLKTAMWITEKIASIEIGATDVRDVIKKESIYEDEITFGGAYFHDNYYKNRLNSLGIVENED